MKRIMLIVLVATLAACEHKIECYDMDGNRVYFVDWGIIYHKRDPEYLANNIWILPDGRKFKGECRTTYK